MNRFALALALLAQQLALPAAALPAFSSTGLYSALYRQNADPAAAYQCLQTADLRLGETFPGKPI